MLYTLYDVLNVRRRGFTRLLLNPWACSRFKSNFQENLATKLFCDGLSMLKSAKIVILVSNHVLVLTIIINFTSLIVMTRKRVVQRHKRNILKLTYTLTCSSSIGLLRQVVLKRQGIVGKVFRITRLTLASKASIASKAPK